MRNSTLDQNHGLIWPLFFPGSLLCFHRIKVFPYVVPSEVGNVVPPPRELGTPFSAAHLDLIDIGTALNMCAVKCLCIYLSSISEAQCRAHSGIQWMFIEYTHF